MTLTQGIEVDASVRLALAIESNTEAINRAEARRRQMASEVAYIPVPAVQIAGSALPFALTAKGWGPNAGYNWAVQAVAVEGLGTSDYLNFYKGQSTAVVNGGYGRNSLTITVASTIALWNPGRTGLVLQGNSQDSLVVGGSVAGTVTINVDVIQITDAQLPYFLL